MTTVFNSYRLLVELCLHTFLLEVLENCLYLTDIHLFIHRLHNLRAARKPLHNFLIRRHRGHLHGHRLQLRGHRVVLRDLRPYPHDVFRQDLGRGLF